MFLPLGGGSFVPFHGSFLSQQWYRVTAIYTCKVAIYLHPFFRNSILWRAIIIKNSYLRRYLDTLRLQYLWNNQWAPNYVPFLSTNKLGGVNVYEPDKFASVSTLSNIFIPNSHNCFKPGASITLNHQLFTTNLNRIRRYFCQVRNTDTCKLIKLTTPRFTYFHT